MFRIRDFFYKAAWFICRNALRDGVQVIIAGHNKGWKDGASMGNRNSQSFVSVPVDSFLSILKHTAWKNGIAYILTEESYTSKASLLDMDYIPVYKEGDSAKHVFSGKRVKHGLYRTAGGVLFNADINGAGNIIRKVYPDAFRGMDLSYLWETTLAIGCRQLYPIGDPARKDALRKRMKAHAHKPSYMSLERHDLRWRRKISLMEAFGAGKKPFLKTKIV